jgi:ankyrin repeat protein
MAKSMLQWLQQSMILLFLLYVLNRSYHSTPFVHSEQTSSASDNSDHNDGGNDDDNIGDPFDHFLMACSQGNMEVVEIMIEEHPEFVTGQSQNGESCLHVAGILGQVDITNYVLRHGGNPNQRSTYVHGLRMTPLSWNVYGGHVANVRALLEAGADVNMEFDHLNTETEQHEPVTVLDILYMMEDFSEEATHNAKTTTEDGTDPATSNRKKHFEMRDLLLLHGARRYTDLQIPTDAEEL